MKKFLFVYSLVATISLSFFLALTNPSRSNLIISFMILPVPAYLFLSLTNPKEVGVPQWSFRVILIIFTLSLLAMVSFKLLNLNINLEQTVVPVEPTNPPAENKTPEPTVENQGTGHSQDFTNILIEESEENQ